MTMKLFTLLAFTAILFYPLYPNLYNSWMLYSDNSHGLLVPFISAFFIWRLIPQLKTTPQNTDVRGLIILIASLILYLMSYAGSVTVVANCTIITSLLGIVLYNYGIEIFKLLAYPLLFLIFMIPVPVSVLALVTLPLQRLATSVSAVLISLISIPVYQEGNMLFFAQTQLEVAEACSGIHSLIAMLMLGTVIVYINPMTNKAKLFLLSATVPIAIFANIFRVTGTGILAHFYGKDIASGFLHEFSGIVIFIFGLVILMFTYKVIQFFQPPPLE
jgi:exosortase